MTRLPLPLALALVIVPAADLGALPFPKGPAPLPDGAVRRFGTAPPEPVVKPRAAAMLDDGDVVNLVSAPPARRAAMAQTPDGKQLVIADGTGRIDVFEIATGRLARRLQEQGGDPVSNVAVSETALEQQIQVTPYADLSSFHTVLVLDPKGRVR